MRNHSHNSLTGQNNNKGTTMVETIVAFLVLIIILGIIYGMIAFSSTLRMRAHDTDMAIQRFSREMYNAENKPATPENGKGYKETRNAQNNISATRFVTGTTNKDNKEIPIPLFYLSVDTTETDVEANIKDTNYINAIKADIPEGASANEINAANEVQKNYWISMYNIEADTYTYVPGTDEDAAHLIIPKAIQFIHKEDRTHD